MTASALETATDRATLLDELRGIRELISDKSRWTRDAFAVDAFGCLALSGGSDAVRWCLLGAAQRVVDESSCGTFEYEAGFSAVRGLLDRAAVELGWKRATQANDIGGHAEALAVLDRAITLAEVAS